MTDNLNHDKPLTIGTHTFTSRLIVGTGKYASYELMREALDVSGTECITVAVRRERLIDAAGQEPPGFHRHHAATRSCRTRPAASRPTTPSASPGWAAKSSRRLDNPGADWVKLEVLGDTKTLLPDPIATLAGHREARGRGLSGARLHERRSDVARRLKAGRRRERDAGRQPDRLGPGRAESQHHPHLPGVSQGRRPDYPVIVDAGVGTASDVTIAMELGVDGVLLNTGIAHAKDPLRMARAMRLAVEAGRLAYLAGRIPKKLYATASSPTEGTIARAG